MVAANVGDPTAAIYQRLFEAHPELEPLFFMDTDAGVRGSMLQQCLDCIIDMTGNQKRAKTILTSECQRHEDYNVQPDMFWAFFCTIRDSFQSILGDAWSAEMDREWRVLLAEIGQLGRAP